MERLACLGLLTLPPCPLQQPLVFPVPINPLCNRVLLLYVHTVWPETDCVFGCQSPRAHAWILRDLLWFYLMLTSTASFALSLTPTPLTHASVMGQDF